MARLFGDFLQFFGNFWNARSFRIPTIFPPNAAPHGAAGPTTTNRTAFCVKTEYEPYGTHGPGEDSGGASTRCPAGVAAWPTLDLDTKRGLAARREPATAGRTAFFVKIEVGRYSKRSRTGRSGGPAARCRAASGARPAVGLYAKRRSAAGSGPAAGAELGALRLRSLRVLSPDQPAAGQLPGRSRFL